MIFLARSDGKTLLQRSSSNTIFLNCWDSSNSFHVTFGESYEQAARRELKEETGISALLKDLGKFSYHAPPENEIVAVFSCKSNDHIRISRSESYEASFHTRDEVNVIAASEEAAPWLGRDGRYSHTRLLHSDAGDSSPILARAKKGFMGSEN